MENSTIFQLANGLAMFGWAALIFLPRFKYTEWIINGMIVSLILATAYLIQFISMPTMDMSGFGSLEGVMGLFRSEEAVLLGWLHYLAFDLFVGTWELRDGQRHEIPHLLLIPALLFTFILGPVGLILYLVIRTVRLRKLHPVIT